MTVILSSVRLLPLLLCSAIVAQPPGTVFAERIAGLPPAQWPIGDGGPATEARLSPYAITFDRDGNLLIADSENNRIRKLTPAGAISTVVNCADYGLRAVIGLAIDSKGNLFLSDSRVPDRSQLVRIAPDGRMTPIDVVTSPLPPGIAIDAADNLYITDFDGEVVWKRSPDGVLQRVAGNGKIGTAGEGGPALEANLLGPRRLTVDRAGNVIIADAQRVLRVNPDKTLVRLAGGGLSSLDPAGMTAGPDGSLYIASLQMRIWKWAPNGEMSIVAGTGELGFSDGCAQSGGVRSARNAMVAPTDVALDAAGRLYIADAGNRRLRRIELNGEIRTIAGSGSPPRSANPSGSALQEVLQSPGVLAADPSGNVYFAEPSANRVRQITPSGQIRTIAGVDSAPPGEDIACYPATAGDVLRGPRGVAVDAKGNVYIADTANGRIRRRAPDGGITTLVDRLTRPSSIAVDSQGNIYFSEDFTHLRRIGVDGRITSIQAPPSDPGLAIGVDDRIVTNGLGLFVSRAGGPFWPLEGQDLTNYGPVALDPSGNMYIPVGSGGLIRITTGCNRTVLQGNWGYAQGIAGDNRGNLYVSDYQSIWRIPPIRAAAVELPSPLLAAAGIRNAASNLTDFIEVPSRTVLHPPTRVAVNDSIAPGELLRIIGRCLGPLEAADGSFSGGRLTTALAVTRVLVDGVPAPLMRAQSAEVLAIVPGSAAGKAEVDIVVENGGVRASSRVKVEPSVPGIFVGEASRAIALNADLSLNTAANPARTGSSITLFITGAGLTIPALEDGAIPWIPLPRVALPVTVTVGNAAADVLYAGAVPGMVGVTMVTIRCPNIAPSGSVPVQVTVGGISRAQGAFIAIIGF